MALPRPLAEWGMRRLALLCLLAPFFLVAFAACQSNPIAIAETSDQKAYALIGMYNVVLEPAVVLIEDPSSPLELRRTLQDTIRESAPVIDELENALRRYHEERALWAELGGERPIDRLEAVSENLERWTLEAEALVTELERLLDW